MVGIILRLCLKDEANTDNNKTDPTGELIERRVLSQDSFQQRARNDNKDQLHGNNKANLNIVWKLQGN